MARVIASVDEGQVAMTMRAKRRVIVVAAVGYLGLMVTSFVQARRGQSVVSLGLLTVSVALVLVGIPAGYAVWLRVRV
ncbi:hypothetical protein K0651_06045 [Ornithinimicrobium sp. Arc0846-15]|nr:hypothetical protein [Ornithinimicrobium laminariae]